MRLVLAALFAAYVALAAAMPHGHGASHDAHETHDCLACSTARSEPCEATVPAILPPVVAVASVAQPAVSVPSTGAPLGAVSGQSPPAA